MYHSLLIGKGVLQISKILKLGAGSTWPGHAALKVDRSLIKKVVKKNPDLKIILIAGTNGKTTTTKALTHILAHNGISVLTNQAGANLINGLASLLVAHIKLDGKLTHKAIIFEVDENTLPKILEEIPDPDAIILLNLFRDQLDRYGEVNTIAERWKKSLEKLNNKTLIVANADDPLIAFVGLSAESKMFYTIDNKFKKTKELSHAVDSITCPKCNNNLTYSGISYSHLGIYKCSICNFSNPKSIKFKIKTNLKGTYNIYNLSSVILTVDKIFRISHQKSLKNLESLKPAFGRQENFVFDDRKIMILLSKNPTGFNESLKVTLNAKPDSVLLILNDRIPDGRDISWIWDVDFEMLSKYKAKFFVSGDRSYDMANRLLFSGIKSEVFECTEDAYKRVLNITPKGGNIMILPTYSAMLEIRKHISGKSIL